MKPSEQKLTKELLKQYSWVENRKMIKWFATLDDVGAKSDDEKKGRVDMQGLITRGYKSLNAACYIFFRIEHFSEARDYFKSLTPVITTGKRPAEGEKNAHGDPKTAVNLAFTAEGLIKLGMPGDIMNTFSRAFHEGMTFTHSDDGKEIRERSTLLGDTGENDPARWQWGNSGKKVHGVLMLFAEGHQKLNKLKEGLYDKCKTGLQCIHIGDTYEYKAHEDLVEHFGFKDGISQPIVKGLTKSAHEFHRDKLINPGEFVLGYPNEYNSYSPSPYVDDDASSADLDPLPGYSDKKDLGKNGTYLVFRQIEQNVKAFWEFNYNKSKESAVTQTEKAVKLAAKMVGRWPDGDPLVTCPEGNCHMNNKAQNEFAYADPDKYGIHCPFGAHIRRTNPRDQVHAGRGVEDSVEVSNKHRMLRRGRIYGEPFAPDFNVEKMIDRVKNEPPGNASSDTPGSDWKTDEHGRAEIVRGLHFVCLVSDIERQFEFVQNVWGNTSTFADLCNEVDPIFSPRPGQDQPDCHEFSTPQKIIRNRYKGVPQFTRVVGGAYFFMPGMKALNYILH